MSDAWLAALTVLLPAAIGGLWQVVRFFLDREERTTTEVRKTLATKDEEIRDLRAELREVEREQNRWHRSRR